MKKRICRTAAAILAAAAFLLIPVQAAPTVSASSAIVLDGATGRILWEHNAREQALIASTTKIMTGLLVTELCDLQAEVSVPGAAVGVEGSSLYLKEGEVLSVEALLYGMMLHSGNDAAAALAIFCAGSIPEFAEKMNSKAAELGLKQTHYANPHGLDSEENYSTAYDLAVLTAYAMNNPEFHQVVSCKSAVFGSRRFTNHNKLLWRYEGAVGVKTGYTKSAGRILVSCAERGGRRLIAVTINDPCDWEDHCRMLDYGFSAYEDRVMADQGEILARVPVIGGAEDGVDAVTDQSLSVPLAEGERVELRCELPAFVYAPVLAGEQAGWLSVWVNGVKTVRVPLYWRYTVMEGA